MNSDNSETEEKLPDTPGGLKPEPVENRPGVGQVEPEDYPEPANAVDVAGSGRGDGPGESGNNYSPGGSSVGASKDGEDRPAD